MKKLKDLQNLLSDANKNGDIKSEICVLLKIGELILDDDLNGAHWHFKHAEDVARATGLSEYLHEAIGGQGRVMRRQKGGNSKAIDFFHKAEKAAEQIGFIVDAARWKLSRASTLREEGDLAGCTQIIKEAENLLRPRSKGLSFIGSANLSDKKSVLALAELEGQIGLTSYAKGDSDGAEEAYRNALSLAQRVNSFSDISLWAMNLGNSYSRRRRYGESIRYYNIAVNACLKINNGRRLSDIAGNIASCFMYAHRHREGGDHLVTIADSTSDVRVQMSILDKALNLYDQGIELQRTVEIGNRARDLAKSLAMPKFYIDRYDSYVQKAEKTLSNPPHKLIEGPTPLELFLPHIMVKTEKEKDKNIELAKDAAHLVCDVKLGLYLSGGNKWKATFDGDILDTIESVPALDVKTFTDTIEWLIEKEETDSVIELLQRYKGIGFALPMLRHFLHSDISCQEAKDYILASQVLRKQIDTLKGPVQYDFYRRIHAVRRAGESFLECGEKLRERDPILNARFGGITRPNELINALPYSSPVAIVDYILTQKCICGVILIRLNNKIKTFPFKAVSFTMEHARQLMEIYVTAGVPKGFGKEQSEALFKIGKILHDRFICTLIKKLSNWGITQLIFIPDIFTRYIPLHLAHICGEEIKIPGVDTEGAKYLCDVMPVEYAPCLQAVVASQIYTRPKEISRVSIFTDPTGDLFQAKYSLERFKEHLPETIDCQLYAGNKACVDRVKECIENSDFILFGTHGSFEAAEPEKSHLKLYDGTWSLSDMMDIPELVRNPVIVLSACEVASAGPTVDERIAYGIPGALISAGAATVLGNLWPVEDLLMSFLLERFLHHLSHRGYRPSAALFRAVRDMRRLTRMEALSMFTSYIERLEESKADNRLILSAENLKEWIEDNNAKNPFTDPIFWGGTIIVGSGWSRPAGGIVCSPEETLSLIEKKAQADGLLEKGDYKSAMRIARELADVSDGIIRAGALTTLASATYMTSDLIGLKYAKRKSLRFLQEAKRIASADKEDNLLFRIKEIEKYMEV